MDPLVFAMVLAAAAMHAGWNALVKARLEPLVAMALLTACAGAIGVPLLAAFGLPPAVAFPYVAGSVALHLLYYLVLAAAYRRGDMSQVYPIARGGAPLFTALATVLLLRQPISPHALAGVLVLGGGVILMALHRRRGPARPDLAALGFALLTGAVIAGYTVVDGTGARRAGDATSYAALLFVLDAFPLPLLVLWWRGAAAFRPARFYLRQSAIGGAMSLGAYWIAIWAMTVAPIPIVAALRETSVLISAAIATIVLRERFVPIRGAAAVVILAGILMIRLG
jgi:drug/metabolite transporter (DMT)-like permease